MIGDPGVSDVDLRTGHRSCTLGRVKISSALVIGVIGLAVACRSTPMSDDDTGAEPPLRGKAATPHLLELDAGAPGVERDTPSIGQLDFLVGRWEGEAFGGWVEENWAPMRGGTMLGSFRLVKEGSPAFYELMLVAEVDGRPALRVKHFGPGMEPWEEGAESENFPLLDVQGTTAWFGGATYHRVGNALEIFLAMTGQSGEVREERLRFRLVD